jgi:hypothetical protein
MPSVRPQVDFGGMFFSGEIHAFRGGKYIIKRQLSAAPMREPNISQ